jgi:hypothetical protein
MDIDMTEATMEREIAADMRLRGLDPASTEDQAAFEAEVDEIMTAHMQRAGLDRDNPDHLEEIARLIENGALPGPGEPRDLH